MKLNAAFKAAKAGHALPWRHCCENHPNPAISCFVLHACNEHQMTSIEESVGAPGRQIFANSVIRRSQAPFQGTLNTHSRVVVPAQAHIPDSQCQERDTAHNFCNAYTIPSVGGLERSRWRRFPKEQQAPRRDFCLP